MHYYPYLYKQKPLIKRRILVGKSEDLVFLSELTHVLNRIFIQTKKKTYIALV